MARAESVFWEARCRSRSQGVRPGPSTTIDQHGCTIVKGFIIPSRSSSTDSTGASITSSLSTTGTPSSSPRRTPIPGFARPTGGLFDSCELGSLRRSNSLHRPARSTSSLEWYTGQARRKTQDRPNTWQSRPSNRWSDDDLASTTCQPSPPVKMPLPHVTALAPFPKTALIFGRPRQSFRRTKSEQPLLNLSEGDFVKRPCSDEKTRRAIFKPTPEVDSDNAIASESEEEENDNQANRHVQSSTAAERDDWVTRRLRNDETAARRDNGSGQAVWLKKLVLASISQGEIAVESDDEENSQADSEEDSQTDSDEDSQTDNEEYRKTTRDVSDDAKLSAALGLASLHRKRNSMTQTLDIRSNEQLRLELPRNEPAASMVTKPIPTNKEDGSETPREIRPFFSKDSLLTQGLHRASRNQPQPKKGVLKKSGSVPSGGRCTKQVVTTVAGRQQHASSDRLASPLAQRSGQAV